MKLTDFARADERDYRVLKEKIDSLPVSKTHIFENCGLPPGCAPDSVTVGFYRDCALYAMYLSPPVRYSGQSPAMSALKDGNPVFFEDFGMMIRFFRDLSLETAPPPVNRETAPAPDEQGRGRAMNTDGIALPPDATRAVPDYPSIRRELEKSVIGQERAVETVSYQVALHLKKKNPKKPLSVVAYGPTGTGKSETAKSLAKVLSKLGPHRYAEVWTDLNQFTEAHSVYRLIGSPPGYVGYDDKPVFEAVSGNPYTVFVFDELDKAHPEVLKVFMAILDEGRCAARKEQANRSREYDFRHCIFIFTSNYRLGAAPQKRNGLSVSEDVEDIRCSDGAVEVCYAENEPEDERLDPPKRIYRDTEAARKAFVSAGVLAEIAGRFNCFVEFTELGAEAKVRILAKQVIETGFEYGIRLTYISPSVLQALADASASEDALSVRSFKAVIEGRLAVAFAEASAMYEGRALRLEGALEAPKLMPA
jgi:hypothetical protein